jgi:hypothetical protein
LARQADAAPTPVRLTEIDMVVFSSDVDILRYEPVLFGELHLPGQVLASGTGAELSGTTLTAADDDFTNAGVAGGGVVYLRSADPGAVLDGAYEIVSADSAAQLTVSVLRSGPADSLVAPPAVTGDVAYRVSTFRPQAAEAAFRLTEHFGIQPGDPSSPLAADDLVDTEGLRRAATLGVIAAVYAMWADRTDKEGHWAKSLHYQQLFEKARQRCRLSVDLGTDGIADVTRIGGAVRLVRD